MGWLDVGEKRRAQNIHVIAGGNIRDLDRIQQRERRRRLFIILDIIAVLCTVIGVGIIYSLQNYSVGITLIIIGLAIFLYFVLRKKKQKERRDNFRHRKHRRR